MIVDDLRWDLAIAVDDLSVEDRQILLERMDEIAFDADLPMEVRQIAEGVRELLAESAEADQRLSGGDRDDG